MQRMHPNAAHRYQVLEYLYERRAESPWQAWQSGADIAQALGDSAFSLAVLNELGYLAHAGGRYRINAAGILAYEAACTAE
ncbi:MAG: hypothetical protein ACOZB0_04680 [Pseudomonadota bacterium]